MRCLTFLVCLVSCLGTRAQTALLSTSTAAEQAMLGLHNPAAYLPPSPITHPDSIARGILARVSPDSLHAYLDVLRSFETRNSGSDTVSQTRGIGAARRWAHGKFAQWGTQSGGRLLPGYLQFNLAICGQPQHRNVIAVLPGSDTGDKRIVLIEGHMDTRCAGLCDTACLAEGMEDNGSGTALVMELARVMSRYTYRHTVVFMLTIAEEQSLAGATAFADYALQKGIKIKAVMNNDVVGGILCGQTSSAPSCPALNHIDSTGLRLFSFGGFNSFHKGLARFIKLEYGEMVRPFAAVPMDIRIMTPEDRSGRGGDHIPFRTKGFPAAVRFTAANEHGDANVASTSYTDRQHTVSDILGVDTDNDAVLDSFFVDFRYLARNAVINGAAMSMAAIGPAAPDFTLATSSGLLQGTITQASGTGIYRVGIRTAATGNDWDSVYTVNGATWSIPVSGGGYFVSVMAVDAQGVESLPSRELSVTVPAGIGAPTSGPAPEIELLQNSPNPFDEATLISVYAQADKPYRSAYIRIATMEGKEIKRIPITLRKGMNEVAYDHGYGAAGTFIYTLVVDGKAVQSRKMVFQN